jgi:mRNA-degrading endonuclease RelE of RelBE toxin-antitoxin system
MDWNVEVTGWVRKQAAKLPNDIRYLFFDLLASLRSRSILPERPHFGKIEGGKNAYHCHLNKGHPTYVACWQVNKKIRKIEVYYVGTHENAPY